jgi:hypothetical protein
VTTTRKRDIGKMNSSTEEIKRKLSNIEKTQEPRIS